MINQKTIFIISILAGGIGLLSGILIIYGHYLKIRRSLESRLLQAEEEWIDDIQEVSVDELIQTKAGRELLSSISTDELIQTRISKEWQPIFAEELSESFLRWQWFLMTKDKAWPQPSVAAFIAQSTIYSARTTFLSKVVRSIFSILNFFGFLTQIEISAPDLERNAKSAEKRTA